MENRKHGPKAWEQQTKARAYEENSVTAVDELLGLLSQEDQPQRHRSTCQISRKASLTQPSIIGIIHCDAGLKCLFHLPKHFFLLLLFFYICISQASVASQLGVVGHFVVTLLQMSYRVCQWKNFQKLVNIWWSYGQKFGGTFFDGSQYMLVFYLFIYFIYL